MPAKMVNNGNCRLIPSVLAPFKCDPAHRTSNYEYEYQQRSHPELKPTARTLLARAGKLILLVHCSQFWTIIRDNNYPDAEMRKLVTESDDRDKCTQPERANVSVDSVLVGFAPQNDRDWHLILWNGRFGSARRTMNVEVSALPKDVDSRDRTRLRNVRVEFLGLIEAIEDRLEKKGGYYMIDPGLPVTVTGSLFYDVDHPVGSSGPTGWRPRTNWEIHPISFLEFEREE